MRIPTPLRSYTGGASAVDVDVDGGTLADVVAALDAAYRGIGFRMVDEQGRLRRHMNVFVRGESCRDLSADLDGVDEVVIMQALSGG